MTVFYVSIFDVSLPRKNPRKICAEDVLQQGLRSSVIQQIENSGFLAFRTLEFLPKPTITELVMILCDPCLS